jgi:hypothetical protein
MNRIQQQAQSQGWIPPINWMIVQNTDDTPVPPYGVMGVDDIDDDGNIQISQYDGTQVTFLINSGGSIAPQANGQGHTTFPAIVAYDGDDDPEAGETWGPVKGSWKLGAAGSGFTILGGSSKGLTTATDRGAEDCCTAWVRILCAAAGAAGYPGLVQFYDTTFFPGSFVDLDGRSTTAGASVASGKQTVTPASMAGIRIGQTLMLVDGNCKTVVATVTGTNTTARGTANLTDDAVASVTVTQGGSGYTSAPSVTFSGGGGSGASGTATIAGGAVTGVAMTSTGSGYTSAPTVTFAASPAAASSFTADFGSALAAYPVTGVTITDGGSGYGGTAPTVTFSGGSGSGAAGTANLDPTGDFVVSVTMDTTGSGYNPTAPDVSFSAPGGMGGVTATGTADVGGPVTIYLSGVWVQFWPQDYTPEKNDVSEPVVFLATREEDAPDGVAVYLAEGGITAVWLCPNGKSVTTYTGKAVAQSG